MSVRNESKKVLLRRKNRRSLRLESHRFQVFSLTRLVCYAVDSVMCFRVITAFCLLYLFCASCRVDSELPVFEPSDNFVRTPRFVELAQCVVASDVCSESEACADRVLGEPDKVSVDLGLCRSLEVYFLSGTIVVNNPNRTRPESGSFNPDIAIHLSLEEGAGVQVYALSRAGGADPELVAFIGTPPSDIIETRIAEQCVFPIVNGIAKIDLAACKPVANITALRISLVDIFGSNRAFIDAVEVEPESFKESR